MALTAKQEAFAQAVAAGMNQSDAYRLHYKCGSKREKVVWECASLLAKHPKVSQRINELKARVAEKAIEKTAISKAEIITMLVRNAQRMSEDVPVPVEDEDGNTHIEHVPPSPAHIQAANRALELLGKEIGMFVDRKEIRTGKLDTMNERELQEYIAQLDAALGGNTHADTRH